MSNLLAAFLKTGIPKLGFIGLVVLAVVLAAGYMVRKRASVAQGVAIFFSLTLVLFGGAGLIVSLSPVLFSGHAAQPTAVSLSAVLLIAGVTLGGIVHASIERARREKEEQERKAREEEARRRAERERLALERRESRAAQVDKARVVVGAALAAPARLAALINPTNRLGRLAARFRRSRDA